MFLFNIQTKDKTIRFERDITSNKVTVDRLTLIKALRDTMHCGLLDAKNFCDLMLNELNRLDCSPEAIRHQVREELANINTSNDLLDILRFVRTVKDHGKPTVYVDSRDPF